MPPIKKYAIEFNSGINPNSIGCLMAEINKLPNCPCDLLIIISSAGGSNVSARSAFSALVNLPERIKLTTCGCGTVDSAAVTIFSAGQHRLCHPQTRFLLHQSTWSVNETIDRRRAKEILEIHRSDDDSHAIALSAQTGMSVEDIATLMDVGTVWQATDAVTNGFVHEITEAVPRLLEGRNIARIFNVK